MIPPIRPAPRPRLRGPCVSLGSAIAGVGGRPPAFGAGLFALALASLLAAARASEPSRDPDPQSPTVVVVVGAPGDPAFETNFLRQAESWRSVCARAGGRWIGVGLETHAADSDAARLREVLETEPKDGIGALWLVLIGHGTYDGKEARLNLRGPDVSATELGLWLQPFRRPLAVLNTTSSSAPFLNQVSGTNRAVVTATRSGHEQNYTRFGGPFAEAIAGLEADLDKDGQVSLLEAFLIASRQAAEFYKVEGRLVTEHALIDDNGDGLGTPAEWFRGLRATRRAKDNSPVDGLLARQFHLIPSRAEQGWAPEIRARRDALERAVLLHRERKDQLPEDDYYRELERLLLELARFYATSNPEPEAAAAR